MEKDYLKTRFEPEEFEKLKKKLVRYECALDVVRTQLSNLNTYYNNFEAINPIEHIKHRLKSPESIAGKLKKKDLPVTADAADEHLSDIAGIRIICSYAKNIYEIVEIIKSQEAFTVVSEKDYLRNVKKTGYRSYHMIIEIPVFFSKGKTPMRVELQIRTNGMDFWATLEHQLRYKKGIEELPGYEDISEELYRSAQAVIEMDNEMQQIKNKIGMFHDI